MKKVMIAASVWDAREHMHTHDIVTPRTLSGVRGREFTEVTIHPSAERVGTATRERIVSTLSPCFLLAPRRGTAWTVLLDWLYADVRKSGGSENG